MKSILLFLILVSFGKAEAQVVNIPDANFKNVLTDFEVYTARDAAGNFLIIDANDDNEIQVAEAQGVWELRLHFYSNITSVQGIEAFVNLRKLEIPEQNITTLNLSALQYLEELICDNNSLTSLDVSGLPNLKRLDCNAQGNSLLTSLILNNGPALEFLDCSANALTSLDLSGKVNLKTLNCSVNNIIALDVTGLTSLEYIDCSLNNIASPLNFAGSLLMEELRCYMNEIPSVILGTMPALTKLQVTNNHITSLDVSGCPALDRLYAGANPLNYLNLKNGNASLHLYLQGIQNLSDYIYICIDEGEASNVVNSLNTYNVNIPYQLSTYCTFTPGGDYNIVRGSLVFDDEDDGCDSDDSIISTLTMSVNHGTETGTVVGNTGLYTFFAQEPVTYTITPIFESSLFTVSPPFAEINFTAVDSLVTTQNFCLTPNGNHPDLDIVIVPYGAQPGFEAGYKIIYRNKGNQTLSGDVVLNYQDDVLDLLWANPSEDSSLPGNLTWHYNNLAPFQQREIYFDMSVNGPMETPPVNIDDLLGFTALITPSVGDDTPDDNTFVLNQVVVGSLDPNDITCLEGARVHPDRIGEYLHYNINFENTGTAPATFIVVEDIIDPTQFDKSSLQLINASHPMQASITGNKVVFRFDDIQLGPQEKGSITFKIKTLNTLQANDDVTQQANIFFDYNWPIETNEATTVFEVLNRGDFEMDNSVKIYPNPSKGIVNISSLTAIKSTELYDMQGRLLQAGSNNVLDISGRATGMYFLKVTTEKGASVEKLVKE